MARSAPSRPASSPPRRSTSYPGLIDGNPQQVVTQVVAVLAVGAYAVIATFIIVKIVDAILGIRVKAADEELGLDKSVHGETAYQV